MYDLLMRLPLLGWALVYAVMQLSVLAQQKGRAIGIEYVAHFALRLSTLVFMLLIAAAVVLRSRPTGKANGVEPRISALAGSFMAYAFVLFPRQELTSPLEIISITLVLIGTTGAVVALSQLGRSFSVMAESRRLVTSGPYRFVRHPLYLTEAIAIIGMFIQFASVWTALILAAQIAFQLRRMGNEEAVLTSHYPEYAIYSQTTARLIPGIY